MNFSILSGRSRFLAYLIPAVLLGVIFGIQLNISPDKRACGVQIETQVKGKIFPQDWYESPINASARDLQSEFCPASIEQVKFSIHKYPEHLIYNNLQKVYIFSDVQINDARSSAVNTSDTIYICRSNWKPGACDLIDRGFHSRFNRILQENYAQKFDQNKWSSINPVHFKYGEGRNGQYIAGDADLESADGTNGFVCHYAKVSLETDLAIVSAYLWNGDKELWQLASRYPRIEQKLERAIEFYQSLDPKLNREFFKQLTRKPKPCC